MRHEKMKQKKSEWAWGTQPTHNKSSSWNTTELWRGRWHKESQALHGEQRQSASKAWSDPNEGTKSGKPCSVLHNSQVWWLGTEKQTYTCIAYIDTWLLLLCFFFYFFVGRRQTRLTCKTTMTVAFRSNNPILVLPSHVLCTLYCVWCN